MAHGAKEHDTLCWECEKACGRCSWSKNFTPVEGWKAVPTKVYIGGESKNKYIDSFDVYECPEFELLKAVKMRLVEMPRMEREKFLKWGEFVYQKWGEFEFKRKEVKKDANN